MSAGVPLSGDHTHRTWRGQVQAPGSVEACYPVALKWMPGSVKLPLELGCTVAGAVLGLQVPRAALVLAARDQLPGLPASVKGVGGSDDVLCFGSAFQWPDDSVVRILPDAAAEDYVWRTVCQTALAAPTAAFDELSANPDRHSQNMVFDGQRWWFIDFDLALEPLGKVARRFVQAQARQSILDHRARANQLAAELVRRRPADHGLTAGALFGPSAERRLKVAAEKVRTWRTGHSQVDAVWPFVEITLLSLALRLPALGLMIAQRLNVPEPEALWTSSPLPQPKTPTP